MQCAVYASDSGRPLLLQPNVLRQPPQCSHRNAFSATAACSDGGESAAAAAALPLLPLAAEASDDGAAHCSHALSHISGSSAHRARTSSADSRSSHTVVSSPAVAHCADKAACSSRRHCSAAASGLPPPPSPSLAAAQAARDAILYPADWGSWGSASSGTVWAPSACPESCTHSQGLADCWRHKRGATDTFRL